MPDCRLAPVDRQHAGDGIDRGVEDHRLTGRFRFEQGVDLKPQNALDLVVRNDQRNGEFAETRLETMDDLFEILAELLLLGGGGEMLALNLLQAIGEDRLLQFRQPGVGGQAPGPGVEEDFEVAPH